MITLLHDAAQIDVSTFPAFITDWLLAQGWFAIPGDGCECLYAPTN